MRVANRMKLAKLSGNSLLCRIRMEGSSSSTRCEGSTADGAVDSECRMLMGLKDYGRQRSH